MTCRTSTATLLLALVAGVSLPSHRAVALVPVTSGPAAVLELTDAPELHVFPRRVNGENVLVVNDHLTSEADPYGWVWRVYRWTPHLYLINDIGNPDRLMLWDDATHELRLLGHGHLIPVRRNAYVILGGSLFVGSQSPAVTQGLIVAAIDPATSTWRELWRSDMVDRDSIEFSEDHGTLFLGLVRGPGVVATPGFGDPASRRPNPSSTRETLLVTLAEGRESSAEVVDPRGALRFVRDFQRGTRSLLVSPVVVVGQPPHVVGGLTLAPTTTRIDASAVLHDHATGRSTSLGVVPGCFIGIVTAAHSYMAKSEPIVPLAWKTAVATDRLVCMPAEWTVALDGFGVCQLAAQTACTINTVDDATGLLTP